MGKLKGKVKSITIDTTTGTGTGVLKLKDPNAPGGSEPVLYEFTQPSAASLGIVLGATVNFEGLNLGGKLKATAVNPIDKGNITDISYETGTGSITETESGQKYSFNQPYLEESGFVINETVTYCLVPGEKGSMVAVCLTKLN